MGCNKVKNNDDLLSSILKKDKITIGISLDAKPFGYIDEDGKIQGFEADLARLIAKEFLGSEEKIEFVDVPTQERINAVKSGKVDLLLATMTITPERKKQISFSEPYFTAGQVICVRTDSKIESIYDLINKKIIVEIGTKGEANIKEFVQSAYIQAFLRTSEAIKAFKEGYGDAITNDDSLLLAIIADSEGEYRFLPEKLTEEPYGIAFQKSKNSKSLKTNLDTIINEIYYNGELRTIKEKHGIE